MVICQNLLKIKDRKYMHQKQYERDSIQVKQLKLLINDKIYKII